MGNLAGTNRCLEGWLRLRLFQGAQTKDFSSRFRLPQYRPIAPTVKLCACEPTLETKWSVVAYSTTEKAIAGLRYRIQAQGVELECQKMLPAGAAIGILSAPRRHVEFLCFFICEPGRN
jgi:hypothetical protein